MPRRNAGEPLPLRGADDRRVIGLEHEYRVLEDAQPIDFRSVIHRLDADGLRLDPTDPNAYRCGWGGLLTADGPEAEVAVAPVPVGAGCSFELERRATVARDVLGTLLPDALVLEGYSTHLSIELDDDVVARAGRLFASRYAAPMMLLLDKPASPGLLVRPRPARLEICGEHAAGAQLRAAATFATRARWPAARRPGHAERVDCCPPLYGHPFSRPPSGRGGTSIAPRSAATSTATDAPRSCTTGAAAGAQPTRTSLKHGNEAAPSPKRASPPPSSTSSIASSIDRHHCPSRTHGSTRPRRACMGARRSHRRSST